MAAASLIFVMSFKSGFYHSFRNQKNAAFSRLSCLQKIRNRNLRTFSSEVKFDKISESFDDQEREVILDKLNNCDADDLSRFSVTSSRARKIIQHRKTHGPFQNLETVLSVEGFGINVLKSICRSILLPPKMGEDAPIRKAKSYNFVTPEITPEKVKDIGTTVGVILGPLSVSWAAITVADNSVYSWGHHMLPLSPEVKRHHETQILKAAYSAMENIPSGDAYVMESCVSSGIVQQTANIPVNQTRLQLSTILLVLMDQANKGQSGDSVFFQRPALWCRLYGTLVGSERVSTRSVVEDMIGGAPGSYTPLKVPDSIVESHYAQSPLVRDTSGAALLLTTCFLDVNIRKKAECLSGLRGKKTGKRK